MRKLITAAAIFTVVVTSVFSEAVVWKGGSGNWATASEWTPARVPAIDSGSDTATIDAGSVTYNATNDWSNNSTVTIANDATWIQGSGTHWIRAAGDGEGKSGTLILNGSAEFNAGTASRIAIGISGGEGVVQVNDSATLNKDGVTLMLGLEGPNSRGVLDLNGGNAKATQLRFNNDASQAKAVNTYGRVNISGGSLEATSDSDSIYFWNVDAAGYDHAINFDGYEGSVITRGAIKTKESGVGAATSRSWRDLYVIGKLLRYGLNTADFEEYFYVQSLTNGSRNLSLKKPVTWNDGVGAWETAANWVGGVVPDIHGGGNSAIINAGEVTYAGDSVDWSNNSFVCLNNDAIWTQISSRKWIRIAGDGLNKTGLLSLNDSSKFNATAPSTVVVGVDYGSGIVRVNDNATLNAKKIVLASALNTSGVIDLNGGVVTVGQLWFTPEDTGSDQKGANTFGRVYVSGGVLEVTFTGNSLTFQNINASGYDNAIDFDGEEGSIITHGALTTEEGANISKTKSWEELYTA